MRTNHGGLAAALLLCLAAGSAAAQDTNGGLRYGVAPALDCTAAGKSQPPGQWIEANGVSTEWGASARITLQFSDAVATDTIHAAMNEAGARALALVEIQDGKGDWQKAWEGQFPAPAPGFGQTCFERQLPQKQVVQALRFSFRAVQGQIDVNHGAVLRR